MEAMISSRPKVVVCGTFHKDTDGLRWLCREIETSGCRILSPISIEFEDTEAEIVVAPAEYDMTIAELEKYHLRAIRDADIVWLHAPKGYVGISGAFEIGYASALRKPVFSLEPVEDCMLQTQVRSVVSVFAALQILYREEKVPSRSWLH